VERINREVVFGNRATPRYLLREELILAKSEIVAAMKRASEELEERSCSHASRTRDVCDTEGTTWNNLTLGSRVLVKHGERRGIEGVSSTRRRGRRAKVF
jgi:hypothetical protein